ncbi:MAG: hypothetical protein CVV46_10805 [Spirochaetae bacterium HGW-Spirochaetae-2]|nr:MAG: hypothetical protein CVV46_10805 [Spirochaetae bacterium HGW-Spirochaetae-2]
MLNMEVSVVYRKWYEKTLRLEEFIEGICFILLFFTVLMQIFFRIKFISSTISYSPIWTEELSRWLFVYIVFFGASQGIYHREHIGIDLFIVKTPILIQRIVILLVDTIMLAACVILVYYGFKNMPFARMQRPLTLPFTNGALYGVVPISFILMSIRTAFNIMQDIVVLYDSTEMQERDS